MIIVPKFTKEGIRTALEQRKKRIEAAVILNLKRIGEQFVKNARETDTYKDRTGNLRSSIGYVILRNGVQVSENFESRGGKQGIETARKVIEEAKQNFPMGYVLIGVAGMDYAAAVESHGLDVITSSSKIAETNLKTAVQRIKSKTQ